MRAMQRKIIYIAVIFFILAAAFFAGLFLVAKEKSGNLPQPSRNTALNDKKIIVDIPTRTISFYENNSIKKTFQMEPGKDEERIEELSPGQYKISSLSSLNLFNEEVKKIIDPSTKILVFNEPEKKYKTSLDEQGFYFLKNNRRSAIKSFPKISAKGFIVADLNNGSIIAQKNQEGKRPIASLSKLMTALVSLESLDQGKQITIVKKMLESGYGDYGQLRLGETLTAGELLFPLLLSSSNDAAYALAMDYGLDNFIKLMNERAVSLNLNQTSFQEPSGTSPQNVSSPEDLLRLVKYLFENKKWIFDITKLKTVNAWRNNNFFAGKQNYLGGKNGYTDEAGETLTALFSLPLSEGEKRNITIILLGSQDRERDATAILDWLESSVVYREKIEPEKIFSEEDIDNIKKELRDISLLFVGDIMLDRDVKKSVIRNANGNFSFLFQNADFLKEADITFGNLEGPVSDIGKNLGNLYSFRMHPAVIPALKEAGFNVLSVANNHAGDWGEEAFADTLRRLTNDNIVAADSELKIIEKDGAQIGFLAFSDVGPKWLNFSLAESFGKIIKEASEKVDVLIVSIHWGEEYQKQHNKRQEELGHLAIENGAKIVIGHHPHVIQDIEKFKDGLIAYSLGNFIFDQNFSEETREGLALKVIISGKGEIKSFREQRIKINNFYQPEMRE